MGKKWKRQWFFENRCHYFTSEQKKAETQEQATEVALVEEPGETEQKAPIRDVIHIDDEKKDEEKPTIDMLKSKLLKIAQQLDLEASEKMSKKEILGMIEKERKKRKIK